ncbi:Zn-dependent protease with chaperone function [Mycolicibacterium chubuense NBB4]|uniref:Zn-dependent protease with chaperone function n=1 Tax=Mycolicibacterium chubuense (strain NBB4) TaxID=710421 RepID=I4BRK1_MYCCN|nr:M56 family metallopeptidase [Mycolicibacterium chubuense]AFM19908.1 Zn-dependent protease with chaperone function [Mycolicibacterium chubuense NBB4]
MLVLALVFGWCLAAALTLSLGRMHMWFTPGWQLRALSVGSLGLAVATLSSTAALLCALAAQWRVPAVLSWAMVGVVGAVAASRAVLHLRRVHALSEAVEVFRRTRTAADGVLVVEDPAPEAFAVPGRGAVVVVTTGLREALSSDEFEAVLRHERAHLRFRHHLYIQLTELAACVNPLLRRWCATVRFTAERHADEYAAQADRSGTARALTKVALLTSHGYRSPSVQLRISEHAAAVVARVQALQNPRPRRQRLLPAFAAAVLLALVGADVAATADWVQDHLLPETGEAAAVIVG